MILFRPIVRVSYTFLGAPQNLLVHTREVYRKREDAEARGRELLAEKEKVVRHPMAGARDIVAEMVVEDVEVR